MTERILPSPCGTVKPVTNAYLHWEPQSLYFTYGMSFALCVTLVPLWCGYSGEQIVLVPVSSLLTYCVAVLQGSQFGASFPWDSLCLPSGDPAAWLCTRGDVGDVPLPSAVIHRLPGTSGGSFLRHSLLRSVSGTQVPGSCHGRLWLGVPARPRRALSVCPLPGRGRQVAVRGRAPLRGAVQRERRSRWAKRTTAGQTAPVLWPRSGAALGAGGQPPGYCCQGVWRFRSEKWSPWMPVCFHASHPGSCATSCI